jgi:DNA polymerase III delta prime subunit
MDCFSSSQNTTILRDSRERSVEKDQFAVAYEAKLTNLAEAQPNPKMNLSERSVDKLRSSPILRFDKGINSIKNINIPWIEKYRPTQFSDIVLDPINKVFFNNILSKKYFPNLIFYGTPGTGKTTTIINLINEYQKEYYFSIQNKNLHSHATAKRSSPTFRFTSEYSPSSSVLQTSENIPISPECINNSPSIANYSSLNLIKGSVIHLNASDERGIDVIRSQINQFVKSKNIFNSCCKFVILDEVDHMTKNAQQALKYLIQTSNYMVHYCLICNYISKIDESLQQEFVCVRFNQLPKNEIYNFIKNISDNEKVNLSCEEIKTIQEIYKSDIRSIINFIQLNQNLALNTNDILPSQDTKILSTKTIHSDEPLNTKWSKNIITYKTWEELDILLRNTRSFSNSLPNVKMINEFPKTKSSGTSFCCSLQSQINSYSEDVDEKKTEFIGSNCKKNKSNEKSPLVEFLPSSDCSQSKHMGINFIYNISYQYNIDVKDIIKTYFNYIIKNKTITRTLLDLIEIIIHSENTPNNIIVEYFVVFIQKYFQKHPEN